MLTHKTSFESFTSRTIELKLNFDHPLYVSMGSQNDILQVTFLEPSALISKQTGLPLAKEDSYVLQKKIPKQFPDEASYSMAVVAGSTV